MEQLIRNYREMEWEDAGGYPGSYKPRPLPFRNRCGGSDHPGNSGLMICLNTQVN